ncbi:MAG: crossover junction endodeoxyribonuclease RuvC [Patescibacteria group bacterium]
MIILAIDPGYDRMGIAVLEKENSEKEELLFSECFSPTKNIVKEKRILEIGQKIDELIKNYHPSELVIEDIFFGKNLKTAVAVAEVRGVIIYEASKAGLCINQFTPSQIKTAITGNGKSDKTQVEFMVSKLINMKGKKPKFDDESDAIAVGLTFFAYGGNRLKEKA